MKPALLRSTRCTLLVTAALVALAGCKSSDPEADAALPPADDLAVVDLPGTPPDAKPPAPDQAPRTSFKVAAVQYGGEYSQISGCANDLCALSSMIKDARKNGAELAVVPEYSVDQSKSEVAPAIGEAPAADAKWAEGTITKTFARLAVEQKLTVAFNLITEDGGKLYNTNLAIGADGKVLARHFKFQLFGSEASQLAPGPSIDQSFFQTPAGRAGLLVCADVQCIVVASITGKMTETQDCSAHAITLIKDYFSTAKKPDLILLSSVWTVGGATNPWGSLNVQKTVAKNGLVYVVAANTTGGEGKGGGIYKPDGTAIVQDASGKPLVLYAELPLKK
jgi:predicted amidohydrolase